MFDVSAAAAVAMRDSEKPRPMAEVRQKKTPTGCRG
jgi:hypothetical protein